MKLIAAAFGTESFRAGPVFHKAAAADANGVWVYAITAIAALIGSTWQHALSSLVANVVACAS